MILLVYTQNDDATCGIGKGGICLPKTARETTLGSLELNFVSFLLAAEAKNVCAKILHTPQI